MEKSCFGFSFGRRTYGQETTDMATKTGTTISGVKYAEGIVLGADTRSTSGATVADKNCEKIHYIAPNIYCCGAGTAADTEALTGHIGAALVLGGFDEGGAHLYTVYPHGSSDSLPFATMGSGSLAAMSVFESDYNDNMNEEEAKLLVARSIRAGIFNDLGSGSNVDLCVINKEGTKYFRNYMTPNNRTYSRTKGYDHPPGTTVLNSRNFTTGTAATVPVTALK